MNMAQLSLVAALAFVLEAIGILLRARRLPASRWSRNARSGAFIGLFLAALMTGAYFWEQHVIDEAGAYDRQNGFPPHAPTPADIRILGLYGLLLLGIAGFCFVQLALYLRQQRRRARSVSASGGA
jgi:hypothetical protein